MHNACVAGVAVAVLQIRYLIVRDEGLLVLLALLATLINFFFCLALYVVFTTTKVVILRLTPQREAKFVIACANGHEITATRAQAGSSIRCAECGSVATVPPLSELKSNA